MLQVRGDIKKSEEDLINSKKESEEKREQVLKLEDRVKESADLLTRIKV